MSAKPNPRVGLFVTCLVDAIRPGIGFAAIQYAVIVGGVMGLDRIAARSERMRGLAARISSVGALLTGGVFLALSLA